MVFLAHLEIPFVLQRSEKTWPPDIRNSFTVKGCLISIAATAATPSTQDLKSMWLHRTRAKGIMIHNMIIHVTIHTDAHLRSHLTHTHIHTYCCSSIQSWETIQHIYKLFMESVMIICEVLSNTSWALSKCKTCRSAYHLLFTHRTPKQTTATTLGKHYRAVPYHN